MQTVHVFLFIFFSALATAQSPRQTPPPALNQYVAFLNQSVDDVSNRFKQLRTYQEDVLRYRKSPDFPIRMASSGPLETYYYKKALAGTGLTVTEKQPLTASTEALWQLLNKLDQTGKSLETYIRLNDYQRDNLQQSDALIRDMQTLFGQFSRDKEACYRQIQQIYRRYQPYTATDPYLRTEKQMEQVLLSQQELLQALPYYLIDSSASNWPVDRVEQSMLADEKQIADFDRVQPKISYPASDMVQSFKAAIRSIQALKSRAIDENTVAARQSAQYGNAVYLALLNEYNQGLLANHQAFVKYSQSNRQLLDYPKFSPVFSSKPSAPAIFPTAQTNPFLDKPLLPFHTNPAASPISRATFLSLNGYVEFINESLRQLHLLQLILRNFQDSAEPHRDPSRSRQRADLTYSHSEFKIPKSAYQLLMANSQSIPQPYRSSIMGQAEVLLSMLTEMDELSIELIQYTNQKQYVQDHLQRSDAILDRYAYLFGIFDQKKEQFYSDVRRVYESYPPANPLSSWNVAGKALLKTLDDNKDVLLGVKAYLSGTSNQVPTANNLAADGRKLITDEYRNLKGLQRYGRNDGLCPYSPYEDIAENSVRFAEMVQGVKMPESSSTRHPYEAFYYFYTNQLVYEYNNFCELAKEKLLKAIVQPDVFAFRRLSPSTRLPQKTEQPPSNPADFSKPDLQPAPPISTTGQNSKPIVTNQSQSQRDTVYVERTKVDTVYMDRTGQREVSSTLTGFATNNMVLLLDVSGSMDAPDKLPLMKRSINALLKLLRPEDQLSIVIYSGKARVALKPTSGANTAAIGQVVDALESSGDTDGNGGFRLAYKLANKQYIRAGNNRIILATDGEFSVSDEVLQLIGESARQDIYLTVFTFGHHALTGQNLKKLSLLGQGTYTHVTPENANSQLILEAQAKKMLPK